ncbi:MarR family transcriptional regulator [Candidatus Gracilibacteria bacterium]|nr:MarR family transcriptional regulator [Candidatus Gracilibacteria bacterium]MCF7898513.1 MarR family transcriptional regulator [Candidatus Paceibacterota bacterium]
MSSQVNKITDSWNFSNCFMYSIHQLHASVQKHLEQTLSKKKTISFSQFMVLIGFNCSNSTPLSQTSIAKYSQLTEATISRHITTLVSLGYLSKKENDENRRKYHVSITKKGITAFRRAEKIINDELVTIFESITEKDKKNITKNFNNVLARLISKK